MPHTEKKLGHIRSGNTAVTPVTKTALKTQETILQKYVDLYNKYDILLLDMKTEQTASLQRVQKLLSEAMRANRRGSEGERAFLAVLPATLPGTYVCKTPSANVPFALNPCEINAYSGIAEPGHPGRATSCPCPCPSRSAEVADVADGNPSATDPLQPNSNKISDMSGVAEWTPFFVKKTLREYGPQRVRLLQMAAALYKFGAREQELL